MSPSESAQANKTGKNNQTSPHVDADKEPVKVASTAIFKRRNSATIIQYLHVCMCMFFNRQL